MPSIRFLTALLVLVLTVGCKAQTAVTAVSGPALDRRIEVLIRSQFNISPDTTLRIGARSPSQFPGYDTLPITITTESKSLMNNFLISTDNTKLVYLDTMDLTKDPADSIPIDGRPIRGNPAAKVTVINFDDLECPYCAMMHKELFPATLDHYKNLVRFVYKDDPLTEIHPWAMHAAVDANCMAAQSGDVYWTYVDYLHTHGQEISGTDRDIAKSFAALDRVARQEATLGKLDQTRLDACIAKQDETQVHESAKLARGLGIEGTPEVYVNGEKVREGAVSQDELWVVIDRALHDQGEQPPPSEAPTPVAASGAASGPASGAAK